MNCGEQSPSSADPGAFATELRVRVVEATTSLEAAEVLGEPLIAQIAEADLADLRAMAVRNDIELTEPPL